MSDDSILKRMITTRYIIPLKIVTGAFVAVLLLPILKPEASLVGFYRIVGDCVTYSFVTCMLYTAGEYVFHIVPRIGRWILKRNSFTPSLNE